MSAAEPDALTNAALALVAKAESNGGLRWENDGPDGDWLVIAVRADLACDVMNAVDPVFAEQGFEEIYFDESEKDQ